MLNWLTQTGVRICPTLLLAVFTSYLTVRLALKRFHQERWWERKADAYSRLIESLHHVINYYETLSRDSMEMRDENEIQRSKLDGRYKEAREELTKATGIGAYIICDEAALTLSRLDKEPRLDWKQCASWDVFDYEAGLCKQALIEMKRISKKDLGVK